MVTGEPVRGKGSDGETPEVLTPGELDARFGEVEVGVLTKPKLRAQVQAVLGDAPKYSVEELWRFAQSLPIKWEDSDSVEDIARKSLELLNEGVASPSWIGDVFGDAVEEKLVGLEEVPDDFDVEVDLGKGVMFSLDLGAFAYFQNNSTSQQQIELYRSLQQRVFALQKEYGFKLVQAPAGDCYVGFVEEKAELSSEENMRRVYTILAAVHQSMDTIPVPNERLKADNERYRDGFFKSTVTAVNVDKGDLIAQLYTGKSGYGKGFMTIGGRAYAQMKEVDEDLTSKRKVHFDDALRARLAEFGVEVDENGEVEEIYPSKFYDFSQEEVPQSRRDFPLAVLQVLAAAGLRDGALEEWKLRLEGKGSKEDILTQDMGMVCVGVMMGSLSDEAANPKKYAAAYSEIRHLLNKKKFKKFSAFKKDETVLYIEVGGLDLARGDDELLVDFMLRVGQICEKHEVDSAEVSAWGNTLVRLPVGESAVQEISGKNIIFVARAKKLRGVGCLHSSVCLQATGTLALHEMKTGEFDLKGMGRAQYLMYLKERLFEKTVADVMSGLRGQTLFGVEEYQKRLAEIVSAPGSVATLGLFGESGSGKSALMRWLVSENKEVALNILKLGDDDVAVIRGLLYALDPAAYPKELSLTAVLTCFRAILADGGAKFDGKVLVFDHASYSETEIGLLNDLVLALTARRKSTIIYNGAFPVEEEGTFHERMQIEQLSCGEAAQLLAKVKGGIFTSGRVSAVNITQLESAFEAAECFGVSRTARRVMNVYAEALRMEGGRIWFDEGVLKNPAVNLGALAARVREHSVSLSQRRLLKFLSKIRIPMSVEVLMRVGGLSGEVEEFRNDLVFLKEAGFLGEKDCHYFLADEGERAAMGDLVADEFNERIISGMVLRLCGDWQGPVVDENLSLAKAMLAHSFEAKVSRMNLCRDLGAYYFGSGRLSAANAVYKQYNETFGLNFVGKNESEVIDFYLDAAWSFYHSGEKEDLEVAMRICEACEQQGCSEAQKARVVWTKLRLIMRGCYPGELEACDAGKELLANIDPGKDQKYVDDINKRVKRVSHISKLIEDVRGMEFSESDGLLVALDLARIYLNLFALRGTNATYAQSRKEVLYQEMLALDGAEISNATYAALAGRMRGGVCIETGRLEDAIEKLTPVVGVYDDLAAPDFIQSIEVQTGLLETIFAQLNGQLELSEDEVRDQKTCRFFDVSEARSIAARLVEYRRVSDLAQKTCLLRGDKRSLWKIFMHMANVAEFTLLLALRCPELNLLEEGSFRQLSVDYGFYWDELAVVYEITSGQSLDPRTLNAVGFALFEKIAPAALELQAPS